MRTTRDTWKTLPLPEKRVALDFVGFYSDTRAELIALGYKPSDMDDRWFIYSESGWVYFHRSWTGACIFGLKLDGSPVGVRVAESWVSREASQYTGTDLELDREMLTKLIDRFFPEPV